MTRKTASIRTRNKPVVVDILDTAEWDIADYTVPDVLLDIIGRALAAVPVSDRDLVMGSIRYRSFKPFVVMFHYSSAPDEFVVNIAGIRPPQKLTESQEFLRKLKKLAKVAGVVATGRGSTGI